MEGTNSVLVITGFMLMIVVCLMFGFVETGISRETYLLLWVACAAMIYKGIDG